MVPISGTVFHSKTSIAQSGDLAPLVSRGGLGGAEPAGQLAGLFHELRRDAGDLGAEPFQGAADADHGDGLAGLAENRCGD